MERRDPNQKSMTVGPGSFEMQERHNPDKRRFQRNLRMTLEDGEVIEAHYKCRTVEQQTSMLHAELSTRPQIRTSMNSYRASPLRQSTTETQVLYELRSDTFAKQST